MSAEAPCQGLIPLKEKSKIIYINNDIEFLNFCYEP